MRTKPLLAIWMLLFIFIVISANFSLVIPILLLIPFGLIAVYVEKHGDRLLHDINLQDDEDFK